MGKARCSGVDEADLGADRVDLIDFGDAMRQGP